MIVFSDMDGTLLTSDKQMSDATWVMLDELARRGIEFVPCTGRPLSGIFEPILAHPAVHYAVCANVASVWQLDDDVPTDASRATRILSRPLDCGIAHRIHRIAAGHDVTFDIFADGQCFLPRSLYGRLDEFCGGDPHIAASLKRTRTPIAMDIDSKIDEINKVKGELPLEVQDLEDEVAGMKTRIEHINAEIEELHTLTKQRKREVDQAKILIGNYKEQQNNVRNNREFDAITKEIEYQELEIEMAEKRLKEYVAGVKAKNLQLEEADAVADGRAADLAAKKRELEGIEAATAPQVAAYEVLADRAKA